MNATELMLGDWVYAKVQVDDTGTEPVFERTPKRVTDLTKGINGIYVEGTSTFAGAEIEPIPLTAEILENNEFYHEHNVGLVYEDGNGAEIIYSTFDNELKIIRDREVILRKQEHWLFPVHELQHALRLCNIGKDIVL